MSVNKHMEIMGLEVKDLVTGFKGVVTSISFDLYGCVQVAVIPKVGTGGKADEGKWFDIARMKIKSSKPVMPVPDFNLDDKEAKVAVSKGLKGPAEKPDRDMY